MGKRIIERVFAIIEKMQITEDSRFMIRKAVMPGVGQGLFAVYDIAAGAFILEYTGEKLPTPTAEQTGSRYLFVVDDEWTVDGAVPENTAGYINHACYPNVEAVIEDGSIMIYALRDIQSGEEITIDYGDEYFKEYIDPAGCKCETCLNPSPLVAN